jgi:hypothetical protein
MDRAPTYFGVMRRFLLAIIALACAAPLQGQTARPLLRYLTVGTHRIDFDAPGRGAARFASVAEALGGKAEPDSVGMVPTRCYVLNGPAPHMILAFYGDPMGTGALTDFDLTPAARKPELAGRCSKLDVNPRSIVTDRGVRIGLPRDDVEESLGKSRRAIDGQPIYEQTQERRTKLADGTMYSEAISSSIAITYRNRTVVAFSGGISEGD